MKHPYPIICILCFFGCNKTETPDYRDPFEGTFQFTTVHRTITMCYTPSPDCVDGWTAIFSDTNSVVSEVTAYETDKIRIEFGVDTIGSMDNGYLLTETVFPEISISGELTLLELADQGGGTYFIGEYKGIDTIRLEIRDRPLVGGYDQYDVLGVRVD